MLTGLVQLNVGDDPDANLPETLALVRAAAQGGAGFVLTPECTNMLSGSRSRQRAVMRTEAEDKTLAALRDAAASHGIWLLIGSLALRGDAPDGLFVNRSFLIGPAGEIVARYDKIHMFDVTISETEAYRESAAYAPGEVAHVVRLPFATLGLSICYDLRFPYLYRALATAGADVLVVPAAFSDTTGAAHWEVLLRARAIENGAWVLAPAQTGFHPDRDGKGRRTHGHSMVVAPWGEVVADAGAEPGVVFAALDPGQVARARGRVPSLGHGRPIDRALVTDCSGAS